MDLHESNDVWVLQRAEHVHLLLDLLNLRDAPEFGGINSLDRDHLICKCDRVSGALPSTLPLDSTPTCAWDLANPHDAIGPAPNDLAQDVPAQCISVQQTLSAECVTVPARQMDFK